jgi:hypothetical protein
MRRTNRRRSAGKARYTTRTIMAAVGVVRFRGLGGGLRAGGEAKAAAVMRATAAGADAVTTVIERTVSLLCVLDTLKDLKAYPRPT